VHRVDYNKVQYRDYSRGRALQPAQRAAWTAAFADRLPGRRPLEGLDLGSGTGRFTPVLADEFGPVTGVEPADRMREIAITDAAHADVRYLAGSAEAIPLPDASVDYTLIFLAWHHVPDKPRAAREIARVTRPGGTLLLRAQFSDCIPRLWWLEHFPRGPEKHPAPFQPLADVRATFEAAGWQVMDFAVIEEPSVGTQAEMLQRLQLRTFSVFEQLTEAEAAVGFERLEAAVAADPHRPVPPEPSTLLTLTWPGSGK
jgi:ubiquinone/menaquinone biosynthesis C-methylase UbiE